MQAQDYIKAILALIFVIGLIGLISALMKKYFLERQFPNFTKRKRRLSVEETIAIDAKRRLVIIKRDDVRHLLLLGSNSETVVEHNIPAPQIINEDES